MRRHFRDDESGELDGSRREVMSMIFLAEFGSARFGGCLKMSSRSSSRLLAQRIDHARNKQRLAPGNGVHVILDTPAWPRSRPRWRRRAVAARNTAFPA